MREKEEEGEKERNKKKEIMNEKEGEDRDIILKRIIN